MYSFIELIPVPVFIKDLKKIYVECNNAFSQFIGRSKTEIIGKTVYDIAPQNLANLYNHIDCKLLHEEISPQIYDSKVLNKDGVLHDVIIVRQLLREKNGSVYGIVGVIFDVTESKRQEEQLRESEQLYKALVEQSSDGILIFRSDTGLIKEANKQFCRMSNYSNEELHRMTIYHLIDEDKETIKLNLQRVIKNSRVFIGFQKYRRKDNTCLFVEVSLAQVYVNGEHLIMGSIRDVTELKAIESDIYIKDIFLNKIIESSPLGYLVIDSLTGKIKYANSSFYKIWKFENVEKLVSQGTLSFVDMMQCYSSLVIDAAEFIKSSISLQDKNNQKIIDDEILLTDGRIIRRYSTQICDNNNYYGRLYMFEDITQRRQTERKLIESESRYRELFSNSAAVKLIIDPQTGCIFDANQTAAHYYGYTTDELCRMKIYDINIANYQEVYNLLQTAGTYTNRCIQFKHKLCSGEIRDVEVYSGQTYINNKKYINSIIIDITARRQIEEELQLQRERLSFVVEGARAGIWDWDLISGSVYYDKEWKNIIGYEEYEISNCFEEWSNRWHPEDAEIIKQDMQDYLDGKTKKYASEYRLIHKSGEYRWILTTGKISRDASGTPLRWAGSNIDITDRKCAEEMLIESQKRLVDFAQAIPDISFIMDDDGRYVEIFHSYVTFLSQPREALLGRTIYEFLPKDAADLIVNQVRQTIASAEPQCLTGEYYKLKRKYFFEIRTAQMRYLANGKKTVAVIIRDITEQRNTEKILQLAYELKRRSDFINDIINEKVIFSENIATLASEFQIKVSSPFICCLLTSKPIPKEKVTYNNDWQILKGYLIELLNVESHYIVWDCRNYIGVLYQEKMVDGLAALNGIEVTNELIMKIDNYLPQITIMIGVSNVQQGLNNINEAYKQALSAIKSLQCQCVDEYGIYCRHYRDLGILQLLADYNQDHATTFIEENIGKLITYDKEKGENLLLTLEHILHADSLKEVAEKMFFHHKTVILRKKRIEKILGVSINSFETRVTLDAAIKLYKIQKNNIC